jgi:hypothetical protein
MRVAELLELDNIEPVEPLFSDIIYLEMDEILLEHTGKSGRILVDEDENPAIFAIDTGDNTWIGCTTLYRQPSAPLLELFEKIDWDMYQENREKIEESIREYYSNKLLQSTSPGSDDLNPVRADNIKKLIKRTLGNVSGVSCLDCCCGTGVGSKIMRELGMHPLAYDNDDSLLVLGLSSGRLTPESTMWIDGREIGDYISSSFQFACGLMFGEIHPFNSDIWKNITVSLSKVAEKILITTGTEPEIQQVKSWMETTGKKPDIFEYDSDPIYDRWVCYTE